jgi:hypothetical protein
MKIQVARLGEKLRQPEAFVRDLHNLMDFYADRTRRSGQFGEPPPLLATYKTPAPVLRQLEREIAPLAAEPAAALALVDALWAEPVIEFRRLAIILLGRIPPTPPEPVLDRIQAWVAAQPENIILDALLEHGLARIRQETPKVYFPLVEAWLNAHEIFPRQAGLRALSYLLTDPNFENLPAVSRLILPWIRSTPADLRTDLVAVLRGLAGRFPQEASYLLKQNLASERPDTLWLARQVLNDLPEEIQASLRETLRPYQR